MSVRKEAERADITGTLGIICGSGPLPIDVARAAQKRGMAVLLLAIAGEADPAIEQFPHEWIKFGEVGRLFKLLQQHECRDLVIVGKVSRPRLKDIQFDFGAVRAMPRIVAMLAGGDDHLLSKIITYFNEQGVQIHGAHEITPEILASPGSLTRRQPADADLHDADLGITLIETLAPFDVGQAVVVENGRVLAIEAAEGTDAMLMRVAALRKDARERGGVMVKRSKPGQDLRVDMAAVGPATIQLLKDANLSGLVIEAGKTIVVDKDAVRAAADAAGIFVHAFDATHD